MIISILLSSVLFVQANTQKCGKEIDKILQANASKNQWIELSSSNGEKVRRSPTSNVGEWVQILYAKSGPKVAVIKSDSMTEYAFNSSCKATETVRPHHFLDAKFEKNKKDFFSDQDLKKEMDKNKQGVIYVWSPKFIYSVKEFNTSKKAIESMGYHFQALMAADDNPNKLNTSAFSHIKQDFRRRNASIELLMQRSDLHSPTMFIYKDKKWVAKPLIGVFTKAALEQELKKYL